METAILVRHAESRASVVSRCSGDPARCEGLTDAGREQARALGVLLADDRIDLCVTTAFRRARETAEVALEGRGVPFLEVPELNDIRFGSFEGGPLDAYRRWAHAAGPADACPGGGESRGDAAARFARGYRVVAARPEARILVVSHALPIRYALAALMEHDPSAVVEPVAYAEPTRVTAAQLERAAARLERWGAAPAWDA